jgi:mono/diheme cytochrome c family protein
MTSRAESAGKSSRCVSASPYSRIAAPRLRVPASPRPRLFFLLFCLLLTASCRQDMQDQPKAKAYRATTFFKDGLSSRPLVEGTVPRGYLREDTHLFTGKKSKTQSAMGALARSGQQFATRASTPQAASPADQAALPYPDDVETFPFPITEQILDRGQERFQIFCSVCHGMTGYGDGMIVRRGFRKPPSYHEERLRQAPVGHFFDVITNGWGAMPSYAPQVPPQDRWAIIAYIRALQLSHQGAEASATQPQPPGPTPTPPVGGHN